MREHWRMGGNTNAFAVAISLLLAFALGAIAVGFDYHGDYQERYPAYFNGHTTYETRAPETPPRMGGSNQKIPCQSPQGSSESELCAEWRAANGSKQAAEWALWQLIISAVGVVGLGFTLYFNKRAIDLVLESGEDAERALSIAAQNAVAAGEMAKSAAGQLRIAQDTAYRQLRAYLSVESVNIIMAQAGFLKLQLELRNAGDTPATISLFLAAWVGPHPLAALPANAPDPIRFNFHSPFINVNCVQKIDSFYPIPTQTTAETAAEGIAALIADGLANNLFVYGRVEFLDFQRHLRVLHFSYRIHGGIKHYGIQNIELIPTSFGNRYEDRGVQP
ncbi:MAG: hypothetical protein ACTHLT_09915 [Devosia sp.]